MDNMDSSMLQKGDTLEDPLSIFDYEIHRVLKYEEISKFTIEDPGYRIDDEPNDEDTQPETCAVIEEELPPVSGSNTAKIDDQIVHMKNPYTMKVPHWNKFITIKKNAVNNKRVSQNQTTLDKSACYNASNTNSNKSFVEKNLNKKKVNSCDEPFTASFTVSNFPEGDKKPKKLCNRPTLKKSFKHEAGKQDILQSSKPTKMHYKNLKIYDDNFLYNIKKGKNVSTSAFEANAEKTTDYVIIQPKENNDSITFKEHVVCRNNDKDISIEIEQQRINNISIDQSNICSLSVEPNIKAAAVSKTRRNTISSSCPYTSAAAAFNVCDKSVYKHNKIIPHYHKLRSNYIKTSNGSEASEGQSVNGLAEVIIKNVRSESLIPKTSDTKISKCENIHAHANTEAPETLHQNLSSIPVLINRNTMPTNISTQCSNLEAVQLRTVSLHGRGIQENKNISVVKKVKNDDKINDNNNCTDAANSMIPVLVSGNVYSVQHNPYRLSVQNNEPNRSVQGLIRNNCNFKETQPLQYQHFPYGNSNTPGNNSIPSTNNGTNLSFNFNKTATASNLYNSKTLVTSQCTTPLFSNITYINSSGMPSNLVNTNNLSQQFKNTCDSRNTTTQNQNLRTIETGNNKKKFNTNADKYFDNSPSIKFVNSKSQEHIKSDYVKKLRHTNLRAKGCNNYTSKHPEIVRVLETPVLYMALQNIDTMSGKDNSITEKSEVHKTTPKKEYSPPILPILSYEAILKIISSNKFYGFYKPHLL